MASREKKSSNKVRGKTSEELAMQEAAERTVEAALQRQALLPPDQRKTATYQRCVRLFLG